MIKCKQTIEAKNNLWCFLFSTAKICECGAAFLASHAKGSHENVALLQNDLRIYIWHKNNGNIHSSLSVPKARIQRCDFFYIGCSQLVPYRGNVNDILDAEFYFLDVICTSKDL